MASQFQEIVAMDLKQHNEKIPIHLINLVTYQQQQIFQIGVFVYGKPQKFLTDIRGEFANADLLEMAEQQKLM